MDPNDSPQDKTKRTKQQPETTMEETRCRGQKRKKIRGMGWMRRRRRNQRHAMTDKPARRTWGSGELNRPPPYQKIKNNKNNKHKNNSNKNNKNSKNNKNDKNDNNEHE